MEEEKSAQMMVLVVMMMGKTEGKTLLFVGS
jgi:hypothetical protein